MDMDRTTQQLPDPRVQPTLEQAGELAEILGILPDPRVQPTVTVEKAGEVLGIGRSTAYAAAHAGELPTIRIGRRLLVPTAALLGMLGITSGAA